MKNIMLKNAAMFFAVAAASTVAHAQNWTWTGAESSNWSDERNWTDGTNPPGDINLLNGTTVRIGMGPNLPANQDIDGLSVSTLQIGTLTADLKVDGNKIRIQNNIVHMDSSTANQAPFEIVFSNHLEFAAGASIGQAYRPMRFYGRLSEDGGSRRFVFNNGELHYYGPVEFTGGFQNPQMHFHSNKFP